MFLSVKIWLFLAGGRAISWAIRLAGEEAGTEIICSLAHTERELREEKVYPGLPPPGLNQGVSQEPCTNQKRAEDFLCAVSVHGCMSPIFVKLHL